MYTQIIKKKVVFFIFFSLLQNTAQAIDRDNGLDLLQHQLFQADMLFQTNPDSSAHEIIQSLTQNPASTQIYSQTLPLDIEGGFVFDAFSVATDDGSDGSYSANAQNVAAGYFTTAMRYLAKPFAAIGRHTPPRNSLARREQTMMGVGTCAATIGVIAFAANQCWSGVSYLGRLAYQSIRQVRSNDVWGKYNLNPWVAFSTHFLPNMTTGSFANYCSMGRFGIAAQSMKALMSVTAEYKCWELIDHLQGRGWGLWYAGLFGKSVEATAQVSITTLAAVMSAAIIGKPVIKEVVGSISTGVGFYLPKLAAEFGFNHRYKEYNRYIGLGFSVGVGLMMGYVPSDVF